MVSAPRRTGKGRQKVQMVKMENKRNMQATFSKRRYGLFKKASELCTLTGAEIAIIVYSPGRKVFSFGHPSIQQIVEKTFPDTNNVFHHMHRYPNEERLVEAHKNANVVELNHHLSTLDLQIEYEKKQNLMLEEKEQVERAKFMWSEPIDNPSASQLREMAMALGALKEKVMQTGNKMIAEGYNPAAQAMNNQMYPSAANAMGYGSATY